MTRKQSWHWRRSIARLGETATAQELMKSLTGSAGGESGPTCLRPALKPDIDPTQTENEAQQVLYDIGGQFDSGEFDRLGPSTFSAMRLVALAWARMGWAKYIRGENLAAMQFLNSAWLLSQSGTVANRLGQVYEKQGQPEKARHMYALAVAAGGADVQIPGSGWIVWRGYSGPRGSQARPTIQAAQPEARPTRR